MIAAAKQLGDPGTASAWTYRRQGGNGKRIVVVYTPNANANQPPSTP